MIISPPFLPALQSSGGLSAIRGEVTQQTDDPLMDIVDGFELAHGIYPIAFDRRWHGGVHIVPGLRGTVHAIADGEVVAYRVCQQAYDGGEGSAATNAGFVLLKHSTETGQGRTLTFYSLYMHLLDLDTCIHHGADMKKKLPEFLQRATPGSEAKILPLAQRRPGPAQRGDKQKVYRKDVLGWLGGCHDMLHLHIEIFMAQSDFDAYFNATQLDKQRPATPTGTDYWGHSYYVIPGNSTFYQQPPGISDTQDFPPLSTGQLDAAHTLYVEAYFYKGQRYTRSWLEKDGKLQPLHKGETDIDGPDYEYKLYKRANKYYPSCPSDGYELLRFGRILSTPATLPANARATWVPVRFSDSSRGYIDINSPAIQKLSDADFPAFMDWKKITEETGLRDQDGLCDIDSLKKLLKDAAANQSAEERANPLEHKKEDALVRYVKERDDIRHKLRGFVCKSVSEWDGSNNEARYGKLKSEGEFYHGDEAGYDKFIKLLSSLQFWDKTDFAAGEQLWFFHPLQFIRHFRRCGWLSEKELVSLVPDSALRATKLKDMPKEASPVWVSEKVILDRPSMRLIEKIRSNLNKSMQKFCIAPDPWRMAAFLGNVMQETQWLTKLYENNKETRYFPWDGRGLLQLTWPVNYIKYWDFLGRKIPESLRKALIEAHAKADKERNCVPLSDINFKELTAEMRQWRKDVADSSIDAVGSAGAYWSWSDAARYADKPTSWRRIAQTTFQPNGTAVYYTSENFLLVARTVNVGNANVEKSSAKVNGIEARYQAYVSALTILADRLELPGVNSETQEIPEGYKRRHGS